jgi:HYR domain
MEPRLTSRLFLWASLSLSMVLSGHAQIAQPCCAHTFIGNSPDEGNPGWHQEAQGLTHDADYWYVTQNPAFRPSGNEIVGGPRLWRIPVTTNLSSGVDCGAGGVSCKELRDTPLFKAGYNHYGDLDFYEFDGQGYLLIPIEGYFGPGVAVFRADETLSFVAFAQVPGQTKWGWLAIDPNGLLVSSDGGLIYDFRRYTVDWARLRDTGELQIAFLDFVPILDEGGGSLPLDSAQGGEFSDDGQLLYFENGYLGDQDPTWGLHVFRTRTGTADECGAQGSCMVARRIERSHDGPGGFAFEFDPTRFVYEEPEGLTYWDLDADGRAPGLHGQLHAILLDNDEPDSDDVYVKHYQRSSEDPEPPEIFCPANVTAECSAHTGVPAGDAQLSPFFGGVWARDNCSESPTITSNAPGLFGLGSTAVTFTAADGFGNQSQCLASVRVVDTTQPDIVCPAPVAVECTSPAGIGASDPQLAPFFSVARASDVCDAAPVLANNAPGTLPFGSTTVTFTALDASANNRACSSVVRVGDTIAPAITVSLSQTLLSPANHEMIPITATVMVTDRCDSTAKFALVSITSNEPPESRGDGTTIPDVQGASVGTPDTTFLLRAERSGTGTGRIYTIVYRATDAAGNSREATATVVVPLHQ